MTDNPIISTRVDAETFARLKSICQQRGISMYDLLQLFCMTIVRYMDDDHNLSEDLRRVMQLLGDPTQWRRMNTLMEQTADMQLMEQYGILRRKNRHGDIVCHVSSPLMGEQHITYNVADIFSRFLLSLLPDLYKRLERLGEELGTRDVLDTLRVLTDERMDDPYEQEVRKQFEDNDWVTNSQRKRKPEDKTRRTMQRDMETLF